jgi:tetratricopeptide (TPR) repeat protein
MTYTELKTKYNQVLDFIAKRRVKDALDTLRYLCNHGRNLDLRTRLEDHTQTYLNMLKYSFELSDDPQKELVYNRLIKAIIELGDDVKGDIIRSGNLLTYYKLKAIPEAQSEEAFSGVNMLMDKLSLLGESGEETNQNEAVRKVYESPEYKQEINMLFGIIWHADKLKDNEISLLKKISQPGNLAWYDKCTLVSALTLSLIRHFDSNKIDLLFNFYESGEMQVWQRALVGLVLGLTFFDRRIQYYPEILSRLQALQGMQPADKSMEIIIIQFIKARETERITRKIQQDILPEMIRMKSKLEEKLDLENLLSSSNPEEKNPEWETFFKESPDVYNKLEEFTNLQLEGADVFLGAFAMLKQFDFFDEFRNWFMPFYKENEYVSRAFSDVGEGFDVGQFAGGIERSTFLCNSDKYSFCLNVRHMPAFQKSTVMELFNMELKAMNEMAQDDDLIHTDAKTRVIITQYFHDLYRFYKLHPLKNEFDDVFNLPLQIHEAGFFNLWIDDITMLRNIGEFYFEKNHYTDARQIFMQIVNKSQNYELFEKIGYCCQQEGHYDEALDYYHRAELLDRNRLWLLTRIAWCYRKTGKYEKAVEYYHEAEKLEPENLQVQAWLGHTCMDMENYAGALKYYFKVEYLQPENHKVQRPISWCSFMLGNMENARKYLEKTMGKESTRNDYLNLGHIYWCLHDRPKAIENYRKSLQTAHMDNEWFARALVDDSKYLSVHGIQQFDIPLMVDYILMSAGS